MYVAKAWKYDFLQVNKGSTGNMLLCPQHELTFPSHNMSKDPVSVFELECLMP